MTVRRINHGALSGKMKAQINFLKWMGRRYAEINPDQSAAFFTAAEILAEIRDALIAGEFDARSKEELTPRVPRAPGFTPAPLHLEPAALKTLVSRGECPDAFCDRDAGHEQYDNRGHMVAGSPS